MAGQGKAQNRSVALNWLSKQAPPSNTGVSWGVPWPRGTVKKGQNFVLTVSNGKSLPLQTWPMAYWPDGSIKWSGFATVSGSEKGELNLSLTAPETSSTSARVQVINDDRMLKVKTAQIP